MNVPDILTAVQRDALTFFGQEADLADVYVLSGGTALAAFHLHHRVSDDLDFFTRERVDELRVRRFAEEMRVRLRGKTVQASRLYDRHLFLFDLGQEQPLKLEFTQYPYEPLEPPARSNEGVLVESLRDIATDKLAALLDRFEPKDYYDLYFLLREHTTLPDLRRDLERKFHLKADPIQLGAAFARSSNLPVIPHLLQPVSKEEIRVFFDNLARSLRPEVLEDRR